MAKRKRKSFVRRVAQKANKRARSKASSKIKLIDVSAMAYGAVRSPVSDKLQTLTANIPILNTVGNIGDELTMGLVNWFVAKRSTGFVREVAKKGLIIENARLGEVVGQMVMGQVGSSPSATTNSIIIG